MKLTLAMLRSGSSIPLAIRLFFILLFSIGILNGQVVGKTTTENYQAEFERQASLYSIPEYFGDPVPVALLNVGLTDDILLQYPELGDYRVGLGLTNITVALLAALVAFVVAFVVVCCVVLFVALPVEQGDNACHQA